MRVTYRLRVAFLGQGMGQQQHRDAENLADGLPVLFAAFDPVLHGQLQQIEEYTRRVLKADAVLAPVRTGFGRVPSEPEGCHA